MSDTRVTENELRQIIEGAEALAAEKQSIQEQFKDHMNDAKSRGYDTKVIRRILAIRKRNKDDVAEEDAITELYMSALGMI